MNKHIELALRTWYPEDNPLHYESMPCILGLVGEAGEIADLVKKSIYKHGQERPDRDKMLAELGDYWYYLRVRIYQLGFNLDSLFNDSVKKTINVDIQELAKHIVIDSSLAITYNSYPYMSRCLADLFCFLRMFDCTIDQLTDLNWDKLQGGKHGWKDNSQIAVIFGSEIEFNLEVTLSELQQVAQNIWDNPQDYADVTGDGEWYEFLKFLWIRYPDGREVRLADIAIASSGIINVYRI